MPLYSKRAFFVPSTSYVSVVYWVMLHPLSLAVPYWATVPPAELRGTPYGLAFPNYWAPLYHAAELCNTLWATLHPNWATDSTYLCPIV